MSYKEMMKGSVVDENISNLTSASSEISASSSLFPQYSSTTSTDQEPLPKKKRSLPGHPDPEAEVIALSPKSLLATNRFICEICNKGFQRDQNLQLHKRGHNLPWKLKQRNNKEIIRKKVYVCPEPTCVHHDPSRALGDLTGIKKHFCRKHGEKKWKCDKCSKRYAVQSDWKAHSKICGTREYKCDCGTLFSRRDSFITHRAFCDALAQESVIRANTSVTALNPLLSSSHHTHQLLHHGLQPPPPPLVKREQLFNDSRPEIIPPWLVGEGTHHARALRPPLDHHLSSTSSLSPLLLPTQFENPNPTSSSLLHHHNSFSSSSSSFPQMSATALLQKASQIGATVSKTTTVSSTTAMLRPHLLFQQQQQQGHVTPQCTTTTMASSTSSSSSSPLYSAGMVMPSREEIRTTVFSTHGLASFGNNNNKAAINNSSDYLEDNGADANNNTTSTTTTVVITDQESSLFLDMMGGSGGSSNATIHNASGFESSSFEEAMRGMFNNNNNSFRELVSRSSQSQFSKSNNNKGSSTVVVGANDETTRDFLGLGAFSHQRDFFNISGFDHLGSSSSYGKQNHNQGPWQG